MKKLPKEIYVRIEQESDNVSYMVPTETPDEHAEVGQTRIVGVYKLVSTVEVSTQIKQEVIVKKSPKKPTAKPVPVDLERSALLDEIRVAN